MRLTEILQVLRVWSTEIELRAKELKRCATIWSIINYSLRTPIILLASIATVLMTLSATEESRKGEYTPMAIAAITINASSVFLAGVDTALGAEKCSSKCDILSKQYIGLSSEMTLDIDTLSLELTRLGDTELSDSDSFNEGNYDSREILNNYRFIKAKYMAKQQAILNEEPSTFFFRARHLEEQILAVTNGVDTSTLDDNALISLRQRTRRASQWKVRRTDTSNLTATEIPI